MFHLTNSIVWKIPRKIIFETKIVIEKKGSKIENTEEGLKRSFKTHKI